jgi:hypothetical protein
MSSIIVIGDLDAKKVVHRSKSSFVIALNIHLLKNLIRSLYSDETIRGGRER